MNITWTTSKLADVLVELRSGTNCHQHTDPVGDAVSRIETISSGYFDTTKVGYAHLSETQKKRFRLLKGDILFSHVNSPPHLGKVAFFELDTTIYHGKNLLLMRPEPTLAPKFLYYFLMKLRYEGYWLKNCKQSVNHASVNQKSVGDVEIAYPTSLDEQQRIVAVLDSAFAEINCSITSAQRRFDYAQLLFSEFLSRAFKKEHSSGVAGPKCNDYCYRPLREVCSIHNGRKFTKAELQTSGTTPVLRVGNLFTNRQWYYSDLTLDQHKYCENGDLLYAWSASFGPKIWNGGTAIYHYHIWKMEPISCIIDKQFLFHFLEWDKDNLKAAQGRGTTMVHVPKRSMEERLIPIPPLELQMKIANDLDKKKRDTTNLAEIYAKKLAKWTALKIALLQRAFSGGLA